MQIWIIVAGIGLGMLSGFLIGIAVKHRKPIGTLRMDRSDPDEAPYLFLELEPDGMTEIHKKKTVAFKVDLNGYSRK